MRQATAVIRLSEEDVKSLQDWSRRGKSEHRLVERARIILLAGEGRTNEQIAKALKTRTARVSKWCQRFGMKRLAGLGDAERSGKPAKYDDNTEKRVWDCSTKRLRKATHDGMAGCWRKRYPISAKIRFGAFCAGMTSAWSDDAVGASVQIRNSAPRRPTLWACT